MATYGSVSAAADVLHVTTSAVSQQVAKLERETGHKLLERNGRGVRLTDTATLLASHAERILAMVEQAECDLEAQRGEVVGELSVAAFPTAARGLLPAALGALARRHPRLRVALQPGHPLGSRASSTRPMSTPRSSPWSPPAWGRRSCPAWVAATSRPESTSCRYARR